MSDDNDVVKQDEPAVEKKPELTSEEKRALALQRRQAAAAKKAESADGEKSTSAGVEKPPSVNQPRLDRMVQLLKEHMTEECIVEATINEIDGDLPRIEIKNGNWLACAEFLRDHSELKYNYLRNLSGVDQETHLEVVYHLYSLATKNNCAVVVKTNREQPSIPSVTPIWATANWNEREVFDLLGIDFPGHPDLRRIMMSDDWIGHPLRKDYVPADPEV